MDAEPQLMRVDAPVPLHTQKKAIARLRQAPYNLLFSVTCSLQPRRKVKGETPKSTNHVGLHAHGDRQETYREGEPAEATHRESQEQQRQGPLYLDPPIAYLLPPNSMIAAAKSNLIILITSTRQEHNMGSKDTQTRSKGAEDHMHAEPVHTRQGGLQCN